MPLVKVIRNGQITIPKELRAALGIFEKSRELSRDPDRRSGYVFEIKSGYIGNRLVIYISCGRWRPSGQWFPTWVKIRSSTSEPGRGPDRSPLLWKRAICQAHGFLLCLAAQTGRQECSSILAGFDTKSRRTHRKRKHGKRVGEFHRGTLTRL